MHHGKYNITMIQALHILKNSNGDTTGIGGETNELSKSIRNIFLQTPITFFVDYHLSDMKRETARHVFAELKDAVGVMNDIIGFRT